MGRKKVGKKPPSKKSPYKRPSPIPKGEVITDNFTKKTWTVGETVGFGGFGDIYSACPNEGPEKGLYNYVVKVEPQENGPLFVEKHFYIRNAKESDIKEYMKANKLKSFGMPPFFGHGIHEYNGEKYRYLILQRYGRSVWDYFEKCNLSFSPETVFTLGLQMLRVLNYIHGKGYIHADIKGGNILIGRNKGTENQAYLVDYGLASRLTNKEYVEDPKSAHDGTLEYISRDGHKGAHTMRGDLEILAYNMLQWLIGTLPWQKPTNQPTTVMKMKINFMNNVRMNLKNYSVVPDQLIKFFEYINTLEPMDIPDYVECERIFLDFLKNENRKLVFKPYNSNNTTNKADHHDDDNDTKKNKTDDTVVAGKKRGRKPKPETVNSSTEQVDADETENKTANGNKVKRQPNELEPIVRMKRLKMSELTELMTPPAKENHVNIGTQTSAALRRNPRCVTFESPLSEVIDGTADSEGYSPTSDKKKIKKRRKLLSKEEEIVTRTVRKKVTKANNDKSWKDAPAILNGMQPKK